MTDEELAAVILAEIQRQYHEGEGTIGAYTFNDGDLSDVGIDGGVDLVRVAAVVRASLLNPERQSLEGDE